MIREKGHFIVAYTKIITDIPNFHKDMETYEVYNGRKTFNDFKEIVFSRYQSFSETGYLFECSFFKILLRICCCFIYWKTMKLSTFIVTCMVV